MMDEHTTNMCDTAWGRPSFAKVLVDVWALGELKKELQVVIPSVFGGKEIIVPLTVEYVWEPLQCKHCKVFGHKLSTCAKAVANKKTEKNKEVDEIDADGFTTVTHRRKNATKPIQQVWQPINSGKEAEEQTRVPAKQTSEGVGPQKSNVEIPVVEKVVNEPVGKEVLTEPPKTSTTVNKLRGILKIPPPARGEFHPIKLAKRGDPNKNSFASLASKEAEVEDDMVSQEKDGAKGGVDSNVVSDVVDTPPSSSQ